MSFVRRIKKNGRVYLAEVENKWVGGKCVQKHIRYVGKEADGQTVLSASLSNARIEHVKVHGPLLLLHHLASVIGLKDKLGIHGAEILSLVYAHCLDYQSLNYMPDWFERTDLNLILDLPEVTEKRLLAALDSLETLDTERLQRQLFHALSQRYPIQSRGVIYDVTNTYLYGHACPMGKPGHDKEGVLGRPLIQIGLGVTQEEGFPLFHRVFDGNVADARTLQDWISAFQSYGLGKGLLIYDRGIISGRNIKDINQMKWDTLCGVPLNIGLKKRYAPWADTTRMLHLSNRHRVGPNVFYATVHPHVIDGVKGRLALCLNQERQSLQREWRYDQLQKASADLAQGVPVPSDWAEFFDKKGRLRQDRVVQAGQFDGLSCLFSTRSLPVGQMLSQYFNKDIVEKAFRSLKGVTQLRPIRHWLARRVKAHVFICYLSYLLLSQLKHHLKNTGFSPEAALKEMESMYKVYLRDVKKGFTLSRTVALTKKQETILKAVDPALLQHSV
jgi:transposase